ncbi:hypothetical protein D3C86_2225660 [compost metagenome]
MRLSSTVVAKASRLTPVGQAAISSSTPRAASFRPSRPLHHQTSAGKASSLIAVRANTAVDGCKR